MAETELEFGATRVMLLELKDERRLIREGYELLDEKRMQLAAEIRRQRDRLRSLRCEYQKHEDTARNKLIAAIGRHGLDELSVYPPQSLEGDSLHTQRSRLLGLELLDAQLSATPAAHNETQPAVNPSPEARACARAHRQFLQSAVALAACNVTLRRLLREYVRTERRARAIENVLLPEVETAIALAEEQLDDLDQEEIAHLRLRHHAHE